MEPNLGVVVHAQGDLRLDVLPEPTPAADQSVVAIAFGGICGSDLHYWQHGAAGESILREPMVLGHEVVGTVAQRAADGSGPPVGTRVAVHPATPAQATARGTPPIARICLRVSPTWAVLPVSRTRAGHSRAGWRCHRACCDPSRTR